MRRRAQRGNATPSPKRAPATHPMVGPCDAVALAVLEWSRDADKMITDEMITEMAHVCRRRREVRVLVPVSGVRVLLPRVAHRAGIRLRLAYPPGPDVDDIPDLDQL